MLKVKDQVSLGDRYASQGIGTVEEVTEYLVKVRWEFQSAGEHAHVYYPQTAAKLISIGSWTLVKNTKTLTLRRGTNEP